MPLGRLAAYTSEVKVIVAAPRGFCAGVTRAVDIVERTLERWGAPALQGALHDVHGARDTGAKTAGRGDDDLHLRSVRRQTAERHS